MTAEMKWPVIDTHIHVGVSATATFIAEEALIPWMDDGGIDIQVAFQVNQGACHQTPDWNPYIGNDYIAKIQRMFPDRVLGLAMLNPWLQSPKKYTHPREMRGRPFNLVTHNQVIDECYRAILELGLWGFKMHPREHGYPVNHSTVREVLKALSKAQEQAKRKIMIVIHAASDSTYNTNEAIMDVCRDFPDLLFLMAHCVYIWGGKTLTSTIGPLDNVLLDLTTCPEKQTIQEAYERYGVGRFVAGTDGPFATVAVKDAIVNSMFDDPEERALVFGGNMLRRLGLKWPVKPGETLRCEGNSSH